MKVIERTDLEDGRVRLVFEFSKEEAELLLQDAITRAIESYIKYKEVDLFDKPVA